MADAVKITSPDDPAFDELAARLAEMAPELEEEGAWPGEQLALCGRYGVFEWFLAEEFGGQGWRQPDIFRGYLRLSAACLTTTFVITQRTGACQRIAHSDNEAIGRELLPDLLTGRTFATVGVSHLTTSRRHLAKPVMRAEESDDGFVLDGFSPWVTGAPHAQTVVTGATLDDGRQILVALPTDLPGASVPPPARLVGLSASQTGAVNCERVHVPQTHLLAGPVAEVMKQGVGAGTGGLQTSTLAIGLADAAITYLEEERERRNDLAEPAGALRSDWRRTRDDLLSLAEGQNVCSTEDLRVRANSLALRTAQAALAAAKGTGYVVGHPAGRWCREALFFLVWSCPQPVMAANLCELAGLAE
ncbi:MAG: acyl-CoA/acyl-ACP dehydrogenase [Planctomycetes bacterium]|nr:acyl-CoA/acyl-ACP dehydrogenase [Planctomycetota bacterium]